MTDTYPTYAYLKRVRLANSSNYSYCDAGVSETLTVGLILLVSVLNFVRHGRLLTIKCSRLTLPFSLGALVPIGQCMKKRGWERKRKRKDIASFQIANGEERRHVMCVGATRRSDSNTEPLGSEASALTNCASCPLPQVPCHGMHWTACINTLPEVIWLCSPLAAGSVRQVFHPGQHKASAKPDLTIGLRAPRLPKSRRSALRHRSAATCSAL